MRSPTAEKLKERLKEFETPRQRMAFMQTPEGLHYVEALLNEGVQPRAIFTTHFGVESRSMSRLRKHNPEVAKIFTQYNQRLKKAYIEKMATPEGLAKVRDLSAKGYSLKAICEQHFNLNYPQHHRKQLLSWIPALEQVLHPTDHTKVPAYRIVLGYEKLKGLIAETAQTFDEIWDSIYVQNYLKIDHRSPDDLKAMCIKDLSAKGYCKLSNRVVIVHCRVSKAGLVYPVPVVLDQQLTNKEVNNNDKES
jgi:hypothetical protein